MKRKIIKIFTFSIILFVLGIFFIGLKKSPIYDTQDLIGKKIVKIELDHFDKSKKITEVDLKNKNFILINFWASWCAPCREEHPFLLKLNQEKNIEILGVNFKDNKKNAIKFLEKLGNPYDYLTVDKSGKQSIEFGVYGIPESILLNNELTIIKNFVGPINKNDLKIIRGIINKL